jgi:hypothetical protein
MGWAAPCNPAACMAVRAMRARNSFTHAMGSHDGCIRNSVAVAVEDKRI